MEPRRGIGVRPGLGWLHDNEPSNTYTDWYYFGWPVAHLEKVESGIYLGRFTLIIVPQSYDFHWRWATLGGNLFCCLLILGATCICCESWLRGRNRRQISLQVLVVLIAIVGILFGWLVNMDMDQLDTGKHKLTEYDLMDDEGRPTYWVQPSLVEWYDFLRPMRWPVVAGIACTIYASVWLARDTTLYAWNLVRHTARRIA
jgi:hypothetical protein